MGVDMSKYYQAKKPGSNAEEEIEQELQENGVDVEEAKEKAPEEVVNLMDEVMKRKKTYKAPEDDEERKELANKEKELGNECYKKKLFEEALEHYNKAIQLDKKNIIFQLNKSAVFFELGQWDFCAQICRNLINRIDDKERHARIALRLANALYNSNELEEAEKYFAVAITDGVKGIEKKYEELKRKNSERRDLEIRKGPTMNKEIERLLMNEEAREIIKLLNESPKNIKIIKNDPKKKELLEKMLRLGIVQSQS
ncbi:Heat shock protein STI1 [Entamoeba marina]